MSYLFERNKNGKLGMKFWLQIFRINVLLNKATFWNKFTTWQNKRPFKKKIENLINKNENCSNFDNEICKGI